jgi:hypothetical protein
MALRLHRVTDEQWQRLAAARRAQDLSGPPARAAIGAIEVELRSLDAPAEPNADTGDVRAAATG